jgi:AcrR family transcriptional regulator
MEKNSGRRLTADDWLDAALAAFELGGVAAVRIDVLAKTLGITRGSFYWHFPDRDGLLRQLVGRWELMNTSRVIATIEASAGTAEQRLRRLFATCAQDEGRLEMALRAWANSDQQAQVLIMQVDQRRIEYIAALLTEAGVLDVETKRRARIAYAAWLGEYMQPVVAPPETRVDNMLCLLALLLNDAE